MCEPIKTHHVAFQPRIWRGFITVRLDAPNLHIWQLFETAKIPCPHTINTVDPTESPRVRSRRVSPYMAMGIEIHNRTFLVTLKYPS